MILDENGEVIKAKTRYDKFCQNIDELVDFLILYGKNCAICSNRNIKCDGMCRQHIYEYLNESEEYYG